MYALNPKPFSEFKYLYWCLINFKYNNSLTDIRYTRKSGKGSAFSLYINNFLKLFLSELKSKFLFNTFKLVLEFSGFDHKRTRQTYSRHQTLELEKEFHFNK